MIQPRAIRLRRPPTLFLHDTPFVPVPPPGAAAGSVMEQVDRRWAALCATNPRLHDGRLCHVLGVHRNGYGGAVIHLMDCAYRFHAVQDNSLDLGVRHLGVKAITTCNGRILLGRRSSSVRTYPNKWEPAPSGVVEPGIEPAESIRRELAEETGLTPAAEPTPVAVIHDPNARSWEIIYRLQVTNADLNPLTDEYSDFCWCNHGQLPQPLSPPTRQILSF